MNLNKLVIVGMSAIMMGTSVSAVLAEGSTPVPSQSTTVSYTVDSTYTWTIHSDLNLTSGSQNGAVTVNSANIANAKQLQISIKGNGTDGAFTMKTKQGNTLNYTVKIGDNSVNPGANVITLDSGIHSVATTETLTFAAGSTDGLQAGSYQGTVTYTARLVDKD